MRSAVAGPTPGSAEERFNILIFDGCGHFAHWADHRAQRFFHADTIDFAHEIKEFALGLGEKADQARRHAPLHGVAFEIFDCVETDIVPQLALQSAAGKLGNEHFVLECADLQREGVGIDTQQAAGNVGDQGST